MFKLNNLRSPLGSNHPPKRKGKGIGSGWGKTAGKGHKGQKARAGGQVNAMFEGGQVPLERRLPKVGFKSALKKNKVVVNLTEMGVYGKNDELTLKDLMPKSMATRARAYVVIIGTKEPKVFPKAVEAHKISPKAKEILNLHGVKMTIVEYKDGARNLKKPRVRKGAGAKKA